MITLTPACGGVAVARKGFFAGRLKELRHQAGLSQPGLALAAGMPVSTIRTLEQGQREPTFGTLLKLAEGLNVPLSAFEPPRKRKGKK